MSLHQMEDADTNTDDLVQQYESARAIVNEAAQQQAVKDVWGKYFKCSLDIAAILYLRAFTDMDFETQLLHTVELEHLVTEKRFAEIAWWIYGTVQQSVNCELCKRSTTERHGFE